LLFFLYCGLSVIWSDFPGVAFKRWFRASGDVLMVLIVLSDPHWVTAVRRVISRVAFVTIPLSILFIRYFPELGRVYTRGGLTAWSGIANGKNSLGVICLIFGLASLSRFLQIYRTEKAGHRTGQLIAYGTVTLMAVYLLKEANSATSSSCFVLAGGPLLLTELFRAARKPMFVHVMVVTILGLTVSSLFLGANSSMLQQLGRDSTLTGRTDIWRSAFSLVENPILGTGFESFWVGPRLLKMERLIDQGVNQAHDGYIEVYLNLGWAGVALLAAVLIGSYRGVIRALKNMTPLASLTLAYFITTAAYNFTEAAIKMTSPLWIAFLLFTMIPTNAPVESYDHSDDLARARPVTGRQTAAIPSFSPKVGSFRALKRAFAAGHREESIEAV
jgi:O-antigen ligase